MKYIIFSLLWTLFFIKGLYFLDPDFGWHIRMGEVILQGGIPKTDQFSYTMPFFPHIDHEWLTDVALYSIYSNFGIQGLAVIFAIITTLTLYLSIPSRLFFHSLGPLLLSSAILFTYSGIRPQVITWLFLATLIRVVFNRNVFNKFRFFIPLLFIFWVNLHGGFAIGLLALFLTGNFFILLLSTASTFINPYGIQIWKEVLTTAFDSSLRWQIQEWQPSFFEVDFAYLFLIVLSIMLVIRFKKSITFSQKLLFFAFLIWGVSSLRNVPLWAIVTLPIATVAIKAFSDFAYKNEAPRANSPLSASPSGLSLRVEDWWIASSGSLHPRTESPRFLRSSNKLVLARFKKVYFWFIVSTLVVFSGQTFYTHTQVLNFMTEEAYYPKNAVAYLKSQPSGEIFANYSFGGYLIWKLPEKKVFIDGRMPSWKQNTANIESPNAFKEYLEITGGEKDFKDTFEKHGIDTVLWYSQQDTKKESIVDKISVWIEKKLHKNKGKKGFIKKLEQSGWEKVYEDKVGVIYRKPLLQTKPFFR